MNIFEYVLHTNLINFLIVLTIILFVLKKMNIINNIQKNVNDIKNNIDKSSSDVKEAISKYSLAQSSLSKVPEIQEKILEEANENAKNAKEKIYKKTLALQEEIREDLKKIFENQNETYKNLTTNEVYQASINLAQNEIIKRLDEKNHRKLIASSIEELDKIKGNNLE